MVFSSGSSRTPKRAKAETKRKSLCQNTNPTKCCVAPRLLNSAGLWRVNVMLECAKGLSTLQDLWPLFLWQVIKCFLAGSFLGLSRASGMCWHVGCTVGIYLWCQPLSALLIRSPVDCNKPLQTGTQEQGLMGLQHRSWVLRGEAQMVSHLNRSKRWLTFWEIFIFCFFLLPRVCVIIDTNLMSVR